MALFISLVGGNYRKMRKCMEAAPPEAWILGGIRPSEASADDLVGVVAAEAGDFGLEFAVGFYF